MVSSFKFYEGGWLGKLRQRDLEEIVLSRVTEFSYASTLVGPAVGEDAGIIDLGSCLLVMHTDPITESRFRVGKLAIDVASNDVAVRGARPRWALVDILMPPGSMLSSLAAIVSDLANESKRLGIEIVGGHTEATPGIEHPIVAATVGGCACRGCVVTTGGVKPGDLLYQVRPGAMEATAVIAADFTDKAIAHGISREELDSALGLINELSIASVSVVLAEGRLVHSMHDPTEGGIIGGAYEMAAASGVDITLDRSRVILTDVTRRIFKELGLDPLKAMSSGTLLLAAPRELREPLEATLKDLGVPYSLIGYAEPMKGPRPTLRVLNREGNEEVYTEPPEDEIARLWAERS